ncbi:oligosaccharyl transferase, archaeosortase A system-associated [Halomicrobium salinisoli]|uniref:oligosaccharyl transferase, archaeosortase A system-associated n=1 Tax=Halomicrobium salinisoli TaxID=2878391 RepID=UPI001CF06165|nr:oligosaccharyl transferase, archaeosortase A system-associated [Halomicrobium salinisoli]
MSQWRGRLEENPELERAVDWLDEYYHLVLGALLLGFMLWNRVRPAENFVVDGEIMFSGNDPWYHYRTTVYTVQNWPATMPFDPWTYFPKGTSSGQFGTLYDQIMATAALVVGLGSPSAETIKTVMLYTPPVFALAVAVVAYFIGKRVGGRAGGVVTVAVVALAADRFLWNGMVGSTDHHIAETLFQALGVLGVMVAVSVAQRDKPVYEQFRDREIDALRETVGWSVLAGFAVVLYLWTWPPGVLLLGILGVYFLLQLTVEFVRGESPEHTAIAGAITMATAGTLILPAFQTLQLTATDFSLLHPLLSYGVAAGCVFMAWLAREFERRDADRFLYPVTVGGILVVGAGLLAVVLPDVFGYLANNVNRVVGMDTQGRTLTVAEAQPLDAQALFPFYGFSAFVAAVGAVLVLGRQVTGRVRSESLLLVVWLAFVTAATFTQQRFGYYMTVPIAAMTGYVVADVFGWIAADVREDGVQTYQAITVIATLLVVFAPMVAVSPATSIQGFDSPGDGIQGWSDGLEWFDQNVPAEGQYGGANNSMDYYGTYDARDDFDYESGQYGVMSWWDYGHWITVQGEAIPNANPFQQGATMAANYLLAPNETQANDVLQQIDEDDAETRYVAVDWQMVGTSRGGKFGAPPQFYNATVDEDETPGPYTRRISYPIGENRNGVFVQHRQAYYETQMVRLYQFHGSAAQPQPVVVDWELTEDQRGRSVRTIPEDGRTIRSFDSMQEARQYVQEDGTAAIGGIGGVPSERVPALEHYRLVGASEQSATQSTQYNLGKLYETYGIYGSAGTTSAQNASQCPTDVTVPSQNGGVICLNEQAEQGLTGTSPQWVKFFERVPGATVEGTGPENATVTARVEMNDPAANDTFVYTQRAQTDDQGNFEMTLPYSTTGYGEYGTEEGYTNVSVRANTSYQFSANTAGENGTPQIWYGTADVTEGQVVGENDTPVTVELNSSTIRQQDASEDGNETIGNTTGTNGTTTESGDGTANETDGTSDGETTATETANSVDVPVAPRR